MDANVLLDAMRYRHEIDEVESEKDDDDGVDILDEDGNQIRATILRPVYLILPNPYENKSKEMLWFKYGSNALVHSARQQEAPIASYGSIMCIRGYSSNTLKRTSLSKQQMFNIQVSSMLRCRYCVVYTDYGITENMEAILQVAKLRMNRIDYRTV